MHVGLIGRSVVAAVAVALVASACTPAVTPAPSPLPSVSATPTETDQQRQERLDYEAAEKAYRTFRAEYNRVLRAGGAKKPTAVMKETAANGYLTEVQKVAEAYKGLGDHQQGEEKTVYLKRGGYSKTSINLLACEDTQSVSIIDKRGKKVGAGEIRRVDLEVRLEAGTWKLWSGSGDEVESCN